MSGPAQNCLHDIPGRFPLKSTDAREISVFRLLIPKKSEKSIQVHNRAIMNPIFKRYLDMWVEATGAIGVRYDLEFEYATLRNSTDCDLEILVRVL